MKTHSQSEDDTSGRIEEAETNYIVKNELGGGIGNYFKYICLLFLGKKFLGSNGAVKINFVKEDFEAGVGVVFKNKVSGSDWFDTLPDFVNQTSELTKVLVK